MRSAAGDARSMTTMRPLARTSGRAAYTAAFPAVTLAISPAVLLAVVAALLSFSQIARGGECLAVTAGIAREIGQLTPDGGEQSYCVYARAGQTMKVTLTPLTPDLVTSGSVISPVSRQSDGGPGGVIFNQKLTEEGRYEIRVGQRFERKAGKFELSVEIK
jgi:hypothetical protein